MRSGCLVRSDKATGGAATWATSREPVETGLSSCHNLRSCSEVNSAEPENFKRGLIEATGFVSMREVPTWALAGFSFCNVLAAWLYLHSAFSPGWLSSHLLILKSQFPLPLVEGQCMGRAPCQDLSPFGPLPRLTKCSPVSGQGPCRGLP